MTINPVLFGVLATLAIESAVLNVAAIGCYVMAVYKKNRYGKRVANNANTKGGKFNG